VDLCVVETHLDYLLGIPVLQQLSYRHLQSFRHDRKGTERDTTTAPLDEAQKRAREILPLAGLRSLLSACVPL